MHDRFKEVMESSNVWNRWIPSSRSGDTAIGKTFEDIIGITENNSPDADLHGVEIKSKRKSSCASAITLFTARPCYPPKATRGLIEKYGYFNEENEKRFYSTLMMDRDTSYGDSVLTVGLSDRTVNILDGANPVVHWTHERLEKIANRKISALGFVTGDSRKIDGREEFRYTGLQLLWGFSFDRFIQAMYDKKISIDFRAKMVGNRVRDHGTGFRIQQQHLEYLFSESMTIKKGED